MQLQDICVIRVRLWVMPYALSILVWTVAENCNWCNHYFVGLVHLLILLICLSLYLSPARRFYFELSVSLSRCVSFFLSATSSVAKPLFAGAHIFHFFLLGWCGLVAWKVCYKTALTSSWRIFLSFRLNAVHRIQLRKIRQPAKRRKTECARENGERMETLLLKIERGKITNTHIHTILFM